MNILLITNLFPNPEEPIRGVFVYNMIKGLAGKADVTVISPLPWFPKIGLLKKFKDWYKFSQVPQRYKIGTINVISPKYLAIPKAGFLQSLFIFLSILPVVRRLRKTIQIDLINGQWIFPDGVAASWVARLLKIPLVLTAHGCDINLYTKFTLRRPQIIKALKYTKRITAVSNAQKKVMQGLGIDSHRISVIHNGVDFDEYRLRDKAECRKKLGLNTNNRIILFVGQIIEVKGLNFLVEAAASLVKEKYSNFKIIAIGEGHLRKTFEDSLIELGLQDQMLFIGEKTREEIPYWYGACDLLCLSSIREGCPSVIVEAFASGRPVVAPQIGGIPELITEENGMMFELKDVKGLSLTLKKALNKDWDEQRIQNSIREYSWNNVANKYLDVFKQALAVQT